MIWTDLTRKAFWIACQAHAGQVDKAGVPYILHPLSVAENMPSEELAAVALLHDVIEDTYVTAEKLLADGIPDEIVRGVVLLTHTEGDGLTYFEYVERLKNDFLASPVKKADLRHNSLLSRLPDEPTEKDMKRLDKYRKALAILDNVPDYFG